MKLYEYVGSTEIAEAVASVPAGFPLLSAAGLIRWLVDDEQQLDVDGHVIATFIIDEDGILRIADRCSEHVACAGGRPVQSAGEITFHAAKNHVEVVSVTNQSTGYCPEPSSWPTVASALSNAGLAVPRGFCVDFLFRRCSVCKEINVIKENVFVCAMCDAALSLNWNFDVVGL